MKVKCAIDTSSIGSPGTLAVGTLQNTAAPAPEIKMVKSTAPTYSGVDTFNGSTGGEIITL